MKPHALFPAGSLLSVLFLLPTASAQTVIAPPLPAPAGSTGAGAMATLGHGGELAGVGSAYAAGLPLLRRDPISVRPHLVYREMHANDLQFTPGHRVATNIREVSPGVLLEIGSRWTLDYTPTWTTYSSPELDSTLDHSATLAGGLTRGAWTFALSQDYVSASPVLFETGQQTHLESYGTDFNATYRMGRYTTLEMNAAHTTRHANEFTRSIETSTSDWLRREVSARVNLAVGFTAGYANVNPGSDMVFLRPQGQVAWAVTDKISLRAEGGVENRRFRSGTRDNLNTPVYGSSLEYSPFATTKLGLSASRDLSTSYFANAITRNRVWRASVEQRLLQRLYLAVRLAQYDTRYITTNRELTAERNDRRRIVNATLSIPFLQRGSFSLIYQTGRNSSTDEIYGFTSRQFGFELGYRF